MANYACEYVKKINKFLEEEHSPKEIDEAISTHLIKVKFFQHERLVHLIVTVLFAIMDIIALFAFFTTSNFSCSLLLFLFTILLVPYIFHYYFLENSVQEMYKQYDKLKDKVR